ncbi:hypothetical protein NQ318_002864 [Aromia moschata]|uniref:Paf1 complex subunit Cdc73 N-terminal domain-containing protein n=1 Tax=Aromia moschata TaxID=1265417 RepID=A0AAV8X264_9CUCU|nr:hypothetical protein NQ318_002864 [Aromia moschata]
MTDPLSLLREYHVNKKEIIEGDGQIIFGEFSWPKNAKTNYITWKPGKDKTVKEYYTLECLLFILKNEALVHPVYARKAYAENMPVVRRPDRKDLLAYLNGEIADCPSIDKSALLEIPMQVKRSDDYNELESLAKKPRFDDIHLQKAKETEIAAMLDTPKKSSVSVYNIRSLSETISAEKIASIKAKHLAMKRTKIKTNNNLEQEINIMAILNLDVDITKDGSTHLDKS